MRTIKSRNRRTQIIKSKKSKKYGGFPPVNSLKDLLVNIKGCVVHNLNNTILIVNYGLHRIEILDMNRNHIGSFGENDLNNPRYINVHQQTGNIIVTDRGKRVQIFDRNGIFIRAIGGYGGIEFAFAPVEVAVTSNGDIILSDIENNRICCVDRNGVDKFVITSYGLLHKKIYLEHPYGLCVGIFDDEERIIIADTHNENIVIFDLNGEFYDYYINNSFDDYLHQGNIVNIAIDDNNCLHCVDMSLNNVIIIFELITGIVRTVQLNAPLPITPRMIRIDQNTGNIYLTDQTENLIAVFDRDYGFLHMIPEIIYNNDFKIIRKQNDIPDGVDDHYECGSCLEPLCERSELNVNNTRNNVNGYIVQLHQDEQIQAPHLFHFKCAKKWFLTEGRPRTCPLCRIKCKYYVKLTNTDISEQNDGVDFFEPLPQISHANIVEEKGHIKCSQYNDNQKECLYYKPKCLWKFKNKQCIDNSEFKGGKLKFISTHSKHNKKNYRNSYRRSLKKI